MSQVQIRDPTSRNRVENDLKLGMVQKSLQNGMLPIFQRHAGAD